MERYSAERYLETLKEIVFQDYRTCTSKINAYTDFIYRFVGAINFTALAKKIRVKTTQKIGLIAKLCQQYQEVIISTKS